MTETIKLRFPSAAPQKDDQDGRKAPYAEVYCPASGKSIALTPSEAKVLFMVLLSRAPVTDEQVSIFLWPDPDLMPDYWQGTIKVYVTRINQALARLNGLRVCYVRGVGYRLAEGPDGRLRMVTRLVQNIMERHGGPYGDMVLSTQEAHRLCELTGVAYDCTSKPAKA